MSPEEGSLAKHTAISAPVTVLIPFSSSGYVYGQVKRNYDDKLMHGWPPPFYFELNKHYGKTYEPSA
jgi:hypothetical protein